jgi:hypothetical protein
MDWFWRDMFFNDEGWSAYVVSDDGMEDGKYVCHVLVGRGGERDITRSKSFGSRVECKKYHKVCVKDISNERTWNRHE